MGSCSALSVPDAQPPGALQCTQPPPPHHPQGCSGSLSRLTCCSLRWEETGLQLARIPAALVAMVTSRLELLGQPPASLWSVDQGQTLEACARGRGVSPRNRLSPAQKEWQPLEPVGGQPPLFSPKPATAIQGAGLRSHGEGAGLGGCTAPPRPPQGVCSPCLPPVTAGALLAKESNHSWHLCI